VEITKVWAITAKGRSETKRRTWKGTERKSGEANYWGATRRDEGRRRERREGRRKGWNCRKEGRETRLDQVIARG
jgi:hypothetical protein